MTDRMYLNDLRFSVNLGATEAERKTPQIISVTVCLEADLHLAGAADDLSRTINYAPLYLDLQALLEGKEFKLIEAVADTVADMVLGTQPRVDAVMVRVIKHLPKPKYNLRDVTVEIHRSRKDA